MHIYFARHGESEHNAAGLWAGTTETPLTAAGKKQAKLAGQHARELHIDHIICSPLGRAHDTAAIIAKEIGFPVEKIELNSLLIERHYGQMEGQIWELDADVDGFIDVETEDTLRERCTLAANHIRALEANTVLVVAHGTSGRMLRHILNPSIPFWSTDPETRRKLKLANAEIVKLQ